MNRPPISKSRTQVRAANQSRGAGDRKHQCPQLQLPPETSEPLEQLQLLANDLLGVSPTLSIMAATAINFYMLHMAELLARAADADLKPDSADLLDLMSDLSEERRRVFDAAQNPDGFYQIKYGRLPTPEQLTGQGSPVARSSGVGQSLNAGGELAYTLALQLKALAHKLIKEGDLNAS